MSPPHLTLQIFVMTSWLEYVFHIVDFFEWKWMVTGYTNSKVISDCQNHDAHVMSLKYNSVNLFNFIQYMYMDLFCLVVVISGLIEFTHILHGCLTILMGSIEKAIKPFTSMTNQQVTHIFLTGPWALTSDMIQIRNLYCFVDRQHIGPWDKERWLYGKVVDHVGIYGSKVDEGWRSTSVLFKDTTLYVGILQ